MLLSEILLYNYLTVSDLYKRHCIKLSLKNELKMQDHYASKKIWSVN